MRIRSPSERPNGEGSTTRGPRGEVAARRGGERTPQQFLVCNHRDRTSRRRQGPGGKNALNGIWRDDLKIRSATIEGSFLKSCSRFAGIGPWKPPCPPKTRRKCWGLSDQLADLAGDPYSNGQDGVEARRWSRNVTEERRYTPGLGDPSALPQDKGVAGTGIDPEER